MTRWCLWTLIAPLLSVIASALCAVSPHMVLHTCSPCSCWRQLVIWNSLQNWAAKSLAGVGHGYCCKERTRRNKREHLPSSLLSCQVSVPIRAHWFPASYLTVRSFLSVFDKSASHNGPCFGGWDHITMPVHILIRVDTKHSSLFKWIHNRVTGLLLHTMMFNEKLSHCISSATQWSHPELTQTKTAKVLYACVCVCV